MKKILLLFPLALLLAKGLDAQSTLNIKFFPTDEFLELQRMAANEQYCYTWDPYGICLRYEKATGITQFVNFPNLTTVANPNFQDEWATVWPASKVYPGIGQAFGVFQKKGYHYWDGAQWTSLTYPYMLYGTLPDWDAHALGLGGTHYFSSADSFYRFDGLAWSVQGSPAGFSDLIFDQSTGLLWGASYGQGLWTYDGANWTNYNTTNSNIPSDDLWHFYQVDSGRLFFKDYDNNLVYFDGTGFSVWQASCTAFGQSPNGEYYVAAGDTLKRRLANGQWQAQTAIYDDTFLSLSVDSSGVVWAGTTKGYLTQWSGQGLQGGRLLPSLVGSNGIARNPAGDICITGYPDGIFCYNDSIWYDAGGPAGYFLYRIIWDEQGGLWGDVDSGLVYRAPNGQITHYTPSNSNLLPIIHYNLKIASNGYLWFEVYDPNVPYNQIQYFDGNDFQTIVPIWPWNDYLPIGNVPGAAWFVNNFGVFRYEAGNYTDFPMNTWVGGTSSWPAGLFTDTLGQDWAVCDYDFYRFDGSNWVQQAPINTMMPFAPFSQSTSPDSRGRFWFATNERLLRFDPNIPSVDIQLELVNEVTSWEVSSTLEPDATDRLWFFSSSGYQYGLAGFKDTSSAVDYAHTVEWAGYYPFQIFYDVDGNGQQSPQEPGIPNARVTVQPLGMDILADAQGRLQLPLGMAPGTYTVVAQAPSPNWTLTTDSASYTITRPGQGILAPLAFGFDVLAPIDSLSLTTFSHIVRCAENRPFCFASVRNLGTDTCFNLSIRIEADTLFTNLSGSPTAQLLNVNTLSWTAPFLAPFGQLSFAAIGLAPDFNYIGDTLYFATTLVCGNDTLQDFDQKILTCAYDPNDKQVVPQGPVQGELTLFDTPLDYTVRFQNTGNDTAFLVVLRDTLDPGLDPESFRFLQSSHPCQVERLGSALAFRFANIQLPDSTANFEGSMGFVQFRVSPWPGLPENTTVQNTAHIYFDFNPAVVTNTVQTVYVEAFPTTGTPRPPAAPLEVRVYPNPAEQSARFELGAPLQRAATLTLFNALGQSVRSLELPAGALGAELPRGGLPAGLYFFELADGNAVRASGKMVWR